MGQAWRVVGLTRDYRTAGKDLFIFGGPHVLASVGLFSLVSPFLLRRVPVVSCLVNRGLAMVSGSQNWGEGVCFHPPV